MTALVTVVIPAYNASRYVGDAVRSVLGQTWTHLECVVVDDGSTDGTHEVVADLAGSDDRLRCVRQSNGGVSRARNAGVASSRGQYVAFLDADDVWMPDKLERQVAALQEASAAAALTGYVVVDASLRPMWAVCARDVRASIDRWLLLEGDGPAFSSTVLLTRAAFDAVGGFREDVPPSEDLHFGVRLARQEPVVMVDAPLVAYRTHPGQHHRDLSAFEANMLAIYAELLAEPHDARKRRRATANLYTRLFFHHVRQRDVGAASGALRRALATDASRVVLLPARVGARRAGERLRAPLRRGLGGTEDLPDGLRVQGEVAGPRQGVERRRGH